MATRLAMRSLVAVGSAAQAAAMLAYCVSPPWSGRVTACRAVALGGRASLVWSDNGEISQAGSLSMLRPYAADRRTKRFVPRRSLRSSAFISMSRAVGRAAPQIVGQHHSVTIAFVIELRAH